MQIALVRDKIIPIEKLESVYLDRGLFFGDGVYEVIRSYNGKIFALEDHLQRFAGSLAAIHITGIDIGRIRSGIMKAFDAAGIANARIYWSASIYDYIVYYRNNYRKACRCMLRRKLAVFGYSSQ